MASLIPVKFLIWCLEAESNCCIPKSMRTLLAGAILGPACRETFLMLICTQTGSVHSKRDSRSDSACMQCEQPGRTGFWIEKLNDSSWQCRCSFCDSSINPQHWHNWFLSSHIPPAWSWRKAKMCDSNHN